MMRLVLLAMVLAGFTACGTAAIAADLDAPRLKRPYKAHPHPAYPSVDYYQKPIERLYSRPVVGFYGYPYDYAMPAHRYPRGLQPPAEPYILEREAPHGIEVN